MKGYGFLSFAKNICKNLRSKYDQKLLDSARKSTTDAIKTAKKSKKPQNNEADNESEPPTERYISPEKRQQIIDELGLV